MAFQETPTSGYGSGLVGRVYSPVRLSANRSGILDQRFSYIFIRLGDNPHVAS